MLRPTNAHILHDTLNSELRTPNSELRYRIRHRSRAGDHKDRPYGVD